jgi:hypothetical protein
MLELFVGKKIYEAQDFNIEMDEEMDGRGNGQWRQNLYILKHYNGRGNGHVKNL